MIEHDKTIERDYFLGMADYLASFWNPEGVRKVQEIRNSKSLHAFKDDQEFEESIVTGDYKNSPILDAVIKLRKMEQDKNYVKNENHPKTKLPTDLSSIKTTLTKFDK
jgi:hypothetical protein